MVSNRHPFIAREGWLLTGIVSFFLIITCFFINYSAFFLSFTILCILLFLYRDPERKIPSMPLGIVSPVDGMITAIEQTIEPYLGQSVMKISIDMHYYGIFSVRSPLEGRILHQWLPGCEQHPQATYYGLHVQTDEGDDVIWAIETNAWHQLKCDMQTGERMGHGQRFGFILFGKKVDVYLPLHCRIQVNIGDHVKSGSDIIATIIHNRAVHIHSVDGA